MLNDEINDSKYGIEKYPFIVEAKEKCGSQASKEMDNLLVQNAALFAGASLNQEAKDAFFEAVMKAYLTCKEEARRSRRYPRLDGASHGSEGLFPRTGRGGLGTAARGAHCGQRGMGIPTVAAQFPVGTSLSTVTYREGDPAGERARTFYRAFGFVPGDELEMFGYPCQKLEMTVPDGLLRR